MSSCGRKSAYLMPDFRASVERHYFWTLGVGVRVKSCKVMFLVWHFLFTYSDTFAAGCIVSPQRTTSRKDRNTDGRTDDIIMPITDNTACSYHWLKTENRRFRQARYNFDAVSPGYTGKYHPHLKTNEKDFPAC